MSFHCFVFQCVRRHVTFIVFSNVLDSVCAVIIFFSNVSVIQKQKTLEQPIKAMRTMILELFRPDGVTPADRLKIMVVISVFQGFWLLACHFILFFFQCFGVCRFFCFFYCFGFRVW